MEHVAQEPNIHGNVTTQHTMDHSFLSGFHYANDVRYVSFIIMTQGIQNIGIQDSQGNRVVQQSQVFKIWENYITELYDRPNLPETLDVEPEEEVDTDEKGSYILKSEVEKAINEMRNKKATGDDDVPGDVLKLLGEGSLKIMTKLTPFMKLESGPRTSRKLQ